MNWSDKALATIPELTPWEGCETCAFLVGKEGSLDVLEVWPTPSLTPSPENYSIGKRAWEGAKKRARSLDMVVIGTIHTHPRPQCGYARLALPSCFLPSYLPLHRHTSAA